MRATIGQAAYARFLLTPPTPGDALEETRNSKLYNMFTTALMDRSGMHILTGVINQDGHGAWTTINAWYRLAATNRTIIGHYQNKLELLRINKTSEASMYVNDLYHLLSEVGRKTGRLNGGDKTSKISGPGCGQQL
jgi:hypothetical protein